MAYTLKYRIEFKNADDEMIAIHIMQDGYGGAVTDLTGSGSPLTVEYQAEKADHLYNPIRFAGATIGIVGFNTLSDLYSNNYQQYKVNIYRNTSELVYTGFIYPEQFSIPNNGYSEDVGIECVSALSTLEYVPFSKGANIISLFELIKAAIQKSNGDYRYLYIPASWGDGNNNPLETLRISSDNFIDEKGEPMNYKEILEQIALFYGVTITEKGGNIYFIDVDYIKAGHNRYFRYPADTFSQMNILTLSNSAQLISDAQSKGSGNTYNIIPSYSKLTILASDYEVDDDVLFPSLDTKDMELYKRLTFESGAYGYYKDYYRNDNSQFKALMYQKSIDQFVPSTNLLSNWETKAGCKIIAQANYEKDNKPGSLSWRDQFEIKLFDGTDYSLLLDGYTGGYPNPANDLKYLVLSNVQTPTILFESDMKIAISLDAYYFDLNEGFYLAERKNNDDRIEKAALHQWEVVENWYIPAQLRIGNYYYNGTTWTTSSNAYFKLQMDLNKKTHYTYDRMSVIDDNTFELGVPDLSGYIVHFNDVSLLGDLELKLYCPVQGTVRYNHRWVFLENIKVECQRVNLRRQSAKEDTIYTNVINENYISEMEDVELYLTSKNESKLSFSKVISGTAILDKIQNFYTGEETKPEEILITRAVNQYQRPKIKLQEETLATYTPYQKINIQSIGGKDFILTSEIIDYLRNKSEVTMIELS